MRYARSLTSAGGAQSDQRRDGARLIELAEQVEDDDSIMMLAITGAGSSLSAPASTTTSIRGWSSRSR